MSSGFKMQPQGLVHHAGSQQMASTDSDVHNHRVHMLSWRPL